MADVMRIVLLCAIILTTSSSLAECYRVLLVWPVGGRSHYILGNVLGKGLAEAGHDVTMISPFEDKAPPKNGSYRNVVLTGLLEEFQKTQKDMNLFQMKMTNSPLSIIFMQKVLGPVVDMTLSHPNVKKLMNSDEKFDAVIVEFFLTDALRTLAHHFNAHLVMFSPSSSPSWVSDLVANPTPLSYIPETLSSFTPRMNFLERTSNLLMYTIGKLINYGYILPSQDAIRKKHFPNGPSVYETLNNCSIVLMNCHESIQQAVPLVPNLIPIGGYHVNPPKKLPKDLQAILDDAPEGVVYVSMGSNLQSKDMPKDKLDIFVNSLGKLKQKVLWKFEADNMPNKPKNVVTRKWLPQSDVLAHPNIKLFVTHGGMGGTTEAVYHGKPTLVIPVFADQLSNALRAVENGYAKMIDFHDPDWSEPRFYSLLRAVLDNPKYSKRAQEVSRLFHDRPKKPLDNAVYWIEYVVRSNGAHHLRVQGSHIPWYKYFLLDLIAVLVFAALAIAFICAKLIAFIIRLLKSKKTKVKKS